MASRLVRGRCDEDVRSAHAVALFVLPVGTDDDHAAVEAMLDDAERARAARFRFAADRASYVGAHALLRATLSSLAPVAPSAWRFATGPFGKPALIGRIDGMRVSFSLSHTRGLAACAVATGGELGVDVEARATGQRLLLHDSWMTRAEHDDMGSGPIRLERAVRLWTLKEAFAKATGHGLHLPLDTMGFALDGPVPVLVRQPLAGKWHFHEIRPTDDHLLSLAVEATRPARRRILSRTVTLEQILRGFP